MKAALIFMGLLSLTVAVPSARSVASIRAEAEGCGASSLAYCLTERQYIFCDPTIPVEKQFVFTCPLDGQYCADTPGVCADDEALVPKTRNSLCETCSTSFGASHSCLSYTHYASCLEGVQSDTLAECPSGTFCDADAIDSTHPCSEFSGRQLLCWRDLPVKVKLV